MRRHTKIIFKGICCSVLVLIMTLEPAQALSFQTPDEPSRTAVTSQSRTTTEAFQLRPFWWHFSCASDAAIIGPIMAFSMRRDAWRLRWLFGRSRSGQRSAFQFHRGGPRRWLKNLNPVPFLRRIIRKFTKY
jgi:hypothetical protein